MKKFLAIITLIALLVPTVAFAEGFGVYEWSATGTAMGDNFMFDDEDAAVLAYNPAGITNIKGKNLSITATWFNPAIKTQFNNTQYIAPGVHGLNYDKYGAHSKNTNNYDPIWAGSLFYTHQLNDKHWLGLGIFPRFGNGISFNNDWEGRYDTVSAKITGLTIQPTWAFKPHEKWSIALGIDINYMNLMMDKASPIMAGTTPTGYDSMFSIDGKCTNVGWLISAMYDFDKKTSAAITYRSSIKHTMDADTDIITPVGKQTTQSHGSVTVPDSISFGVGHKFSAKSRIEFDATWTNWATYDKLVLNVDGVGTVPSVKDWKQAWRFGLGYKQRMNEKWTFLCGYTYDGSPVPDETMDFTVPTGNRHRGSLGLKYNISKDASVTFAYTAIWAASRDVYSKVSGADFNSAHINDCVTQILSLGFSMKFK